MFEGWLWSTRKLQEGYFGVDYDKLQSTPNDLADYLMWNNLAARDELSEVLQEISWKPWSKVRGTFDKERVLDECVDVLHFVANTMVACGITDTELDEAYFDKMEENRRRMTEGYTQRGFEND